MPATSPASGNVDLRQALQTIDDWRVKRTQLHHLADILVIATCAMLCGQGHYTHMEVFGQLRRPWLKTLLQRSSLVQNP